MQKNAKLKALSAAFPHTVPIFAGFWFLSPAYGIMMNSMGFSFVYPMLMSMTIYGGSLEFVAASMLLSSFSPLTAFVTSLLFRPAIFFTGFRCSKSLKAFRFSLAIMQFRSLSGSRSPQSFTSGKSRCFYPSPAERWFTCS